MSHGHVTPSANGSVAKCGGPGICTQCSRELAQFVQTHGRVPDHMVKPPAPDKIVVNGVTYSKEDNHPLVDTGCTLTPVLKGDPRQTDMFGDDKTLEDCKAKFDNIANFRNFPR